MNNLPKISFLLPVIQTQDLGGPNKPSFECSACGRIIYETNFYRCPVANCLIKPMLTPRQYGDRIVTEFDLTKIKK